ncbi:hypothetical protein ACFSKN_00420 [Mariniflexile gromovii]|uniref:Matrixin n=1 Tax=Mariniflexile gromovii TaxID=362523 RepID=A0ABS4BRY9_9FLAO|nr:hypothetical protein [Mariniflexile gromovii]MBP0903338.1 hypothetical protein [Mariniflexile gromovii]
MKLLKPIVLASVFAVCFTCENNDLVSDDSNMKLKAKDPIFMDLGNTMRTIKVKNKIDGLSKSANSAKAAKSYNVALYMAEYITAGDTEEMGNIVYFNNRGNKQLQGDFVPGLALDGTNAISYYVDDNRPSLDLDVVVSNNAIDRAMNTWDGIICSNLGMFEIAYDGRDTGFIAGIIGEILGEDFGGSQSYVADVLHAGWLPARAFDLVAPNGSQFILGVTYTIVFTDEEGNLIDTDNNGKYDVAWREIYYNDNFSWDDGNHYDVETIALHEAGHGLSQGHFGKAFRNIKTGKLHFSPRAVMNAAYSGIQTTIDESDLAGHCSNWSSWFNN